MNEQTVYNFLLIASFVLAALVFIVLFFKSAPYGRHIRRGWGTTVDNRLGWIIMEAPSPIVFGLCWALGGNAVTATSLIFLLMWEAHYIHRAFIYPFGLRTVGKRMPLVVVGMAIFFNLLNGYLNGRYISTFSPGYTAQWLTDPRFIIGVVLFVAGFVINRHADSVLRQMRRPGENAYRVCNRGLYRWISCPNYLGEITIWVGWALATWSLAGLSFAFWTLANLLPRARTNHDWYRGYFDDYPPERKALLPGIW